MRENQGRNREAHELFSRALEIFRALGHLRYQGVTLLNIGAVASHLGRFDEARRRLVESRRIFRLLENPASEANVLLNLGGVSLAEGKLDEAASWLKKALALERQLGNPRVRGLALAGLAHVALESHSPQRAATLLDEALALLRPMKEWRYVSIYLPFHALCIGRLGRLEEAWRVMRQARSDFERVGDEASLRTVALLEDLLRLEETVSREGLEAARRIAHEIEAALAEPVQGPSTEETFIGRRLARKELERLAPHTATAVLRVGPEAAWFECAGSRVDLRRRSAVRRMFRALVEKRLRAPGAGLPAEALVEVGWPGERILPDAAATRVYSGIRTLRSLGLEGILLRHAEGYLLDPDVAVEWTEEKAASRA
ncbi:MAG TPA: tetratricopeptide repeat protein [Fredinandcohnia sp.]|nr:tetratricopeptide repeat protein [Fredinandcohnia sp.]